VSDVSLRRSLLRRLLSGCFCGFIVSGAVLASGPDPDAATNQLILRLGNAPVVAVPDGRTKAAAHAGAGVAARFAAIAEALGIEGLEVERSLDDTLLVVRFTTQVSAEKRAQVMAMLGRHPEVIHAEPDGRVHRAFVPNDPLLATQWNLIDSYGIRAYTAWDIERGAASAVIAILDTGILAHEDLDPGRRLPGYDFVDGDGDPTDPGDHVSAGECGSGLPQFPEPSSWHGLHLAGVVTAATDNTRGVAGINHVSPVLPVRVLGKCGGRFSDIIDGIRWSAGLSVPGVPLNPSPARVINLSLSADQPCSVEIQNAVNAAVAAGAIVVAAAGNGDGADVADTLPAGCNNVIAVAATGSDGRIETYSNLGSRVLLAAPGRNIYSVYNNGATVAAADTYAHITGTSVATAQVSAAVSLLVSAQPTLTLSNIRQILSQTAQPYSGGCPTGLPCGAGILDMHAALQMALNITPGDPAAASGGGGGGGGGCALSASAGREFDLAWLLLLAFLGLLRVQSIRR
jgi:serine protease